MRQNHNNIDRDIKVVRMKLDGQNSRDIASALNISKASVDRTLKRHVYYMTRRSPPSGMSLITATLVERVLGAWPGEETFEELAGRLAEFVTGPGTSKGDWMSYKGWLANNGYATDRAENVHLRSVEGRPNAGLCS